eukprot:g6461.t1
MGGNKINKQRRRKEFERRHVDQLWKDVHRPISDVINTMTGPVGTTDKVELDEDIPGHGQYYCVPCSRYFVSSLALHKHEQSKLHKKRVKLLTHRLQPHDQREAEWAAGKGKPDNGSKIQPRSYLDRMDQSH